MAKWTRVMGVAAIIGMALSAIGVWLVWTTFRETRRQAQVAQDNLDAYREMERGHIEIDVLGGSKSSTSDIIRYDVKMHNVGRSRVKILSMTYDVLKQPEPKDVFKGASFEEFAVAAGDSSNRAPLIQAGAHIEKYPYLGGYVSYRCKFGQIHRTYFCYHVTAIARDDMVLTHYSHRVQKVMRERDWPADT